MPTEFVLPEFLVGHVAQDVYVRWLARKALAHVKRDRRRWNAEISGSAYRDAIHDAVCRSKGLDAYTGEQLDWSLLSQYDNSKSKAGGSAYKSQFALLPTVDHRDPNTQSADFEICGWRTNDCKNDLTIQELRDFCELVLSHSLSRR